MIGIFLFNCFAQLILTFGHDLDKGPTKGIRNVLQWFFVKLTTFLKYKVAGLSVTRKDIDMDYTEYLGPDYKSKYRQIKATSTVVCNHVSWLDGHVLYSRFKFGITADRGFKETILGKALYALDGLFMPRAKSEKDKELALKQITDRQERIERVGDYKPLMIFAEGTTSNGTHLGPFKRGAFEGEKRVRPVYLKYSFGGYSTDYALFDMDCLVIFDS